MTEKMVPVTTQPILFLHLDSVPPSNLELHSEIFNFGVILKEIMIFLADVYYEKCYRIPHKITF